MKNLRGLVPAIVAALCLGHGVIASGAVYTWVGSAGGFGGDDLTWSDPKNWDTNDGTYPDGKDDNAVFLDAATVNYDAGATGVLGSLRNPNDGKSVVITLQQNLLLDYTGSAGSNPTPGSWYTRGKDSGTRPQIAVGNGLVLTLNGLYHNGGDYSRFALFAGAGKRQGAVVFQPDAGGKCYYGGSGTNPFNLINDNGNKYLDYVDFTQPAEIVVSSATGAGDLGTGPTANVMDELNVADAPEVRIGRAGGLDQVWSSPGTGYGKQLALSAGGSGGKYGPKLVVTASGTSAAPNLISFKSGGISGLSFPDGGAVGGGSWIQATGAGVARLVLEGNFTTADNAYTDSLWNMSQIELQMAGEQAASQALTWCGEDKNAGGTGDLSDFSGFTDNYAVRRLIIGSDEGTDPNHVDFATTAGGSAMYVWGLEFLTGGYLTLGENDYIYYLGTGENVGGIQGAGLSLPGGTSLSDFTDREGNIIQLGVPEPATIGLLGLGLAGLAARRRRRR